jgi:hypothetical protein
MYLNCAQIFVFIWCFVTGNADTLNEGRSLFEVSGEVSGDQILLVDGRRIPLDNLVLNSCTFYTELECTWTDENGVLIDPYYYDSFDNDWEFGEVNVGALSALNIADGIGFALYIDRYSLAQSNLTPGLDDFETDAAERDRNTTIATSLDIPAFILSDHGFDDGQARHTQALLRAVGFNGPLAIIPTTTEAVNLELAIDNIQSRGIMDRASIQRMLNSSSLSQCAAPAGPSSAADQLQAIRAGIDAGFDLFAVVSDGLMLAGRPGAIGAHIARALRTIPPDAHALHLESYAEACSQRRVSAARPAWALTAGRHSSAAVILTRRGALRALWLGAALRPGLAHLLGADGALPAMARAGLLRAYALRSRALLRDRFREDALPRRRLDAPADGLRGGGAPPSALHRPLPFLCREEAAAAAAGLRLVVAQLTTATGYVSQTLLGGRADGARALLLSDPLLPPAGGGAGSAGDRAGNAVRYLTRGVGAEADSWVQVRVCMCACVRSCVRACACACACDS